MDFFNLKREVFAAAAAVALGWLAALIKKYVFSDWEFAGFLAVLVIIDTVSGMAAAKKTGVFSSKKMKGVVYKVIGYGLALSAIHVATHFTVQGKPSTILAQIMVHADAILYAVVVFREVISIDENCAKAFNIRIFPPILRQKIDDIFTKEKP